MEEETKNGRREEEVSPGRQELQRIMAHTGYVRQPAAQAHGDNEMWYSGH